MSPCIIFFGVFSDNQKTTVTCSALELHKDSPTCTSGKKTKGKKNILLGVGGWEGGGVQLNRVYVSEMLTES